MASFKSSSGRFFLGGLAALLLIDPVNKESDEG
jgi:hypothetical protein